MAKGHFLGEFNLEEKKNEALEAAKALDAWRAKQGRGPKYQEEVLIVPLYLTQQRLNYHKLFGKVLPIKKKFQFTPEMVEEVQAKTYDFYTEAFRRILKELTETN